MSASIPSSLNLSFTLFPVGPLGEDSQPVSLAHWSPSMDLLPPQACASSSHYCWILCLCWAMSCCSVSSSFSSLASLVSSCGQGCFETDASSLRISACEWWSQWVMDWGAVDLSSSLDSCCHGYTWSHIWLCLSNLVTHRDNLGHFKVLMPRYPLQRFPLHRPEVQLGFRHLKSPPRSQPQGTWL